jgi:DNA-binding MarR family transcriptional regulator
MTNRIDQLEKSGWVARVQSEHDKRSWQVGLTPTGKALIDEAVEEHVKTLHKLTSVVSKKEVKTLNSILVKMLLHFE